MFKWYNGYNKGDMSKVYKINNQDRTRNNGIKLEKLMFMKEIGRNWFSNMVVGEWKELGNYIISAETKGSFKKRLDKFLDEEDRWN